MLERWRRGNILAPVNFGTNLIVTSKDVTSIQNNTHGVHIIEYGLFESSVFTISQNIGFPLTGIAYNPYWTISNPPVLFTFELMEYRDDSLTSNNNDNSATTLILDIDQDTRHDNNNDNDDDNYPEQQKQ